VARASRYLGPALKDPVSVDGFLRMLAATAALGGRSLYCLGGTPGAAEGTAAILREENPGLTVAGCGSALVHVEGSRLEEAPEADEEIIGKINRASPHVLLMALGSPGQELFFERNRHRLKVPVTISIGGPYGRPAGLIPGAPGSGLERLFRPFQASGRFLKHYLHDLPKTMSQLWPSIILYQYARRVAPHAYLKRCKSKVSYKYMTRGREQLLLLTMPGSVDAEAVPRLASLIPRRPSAHLIMDVADVDFIDSAGLGLLLSAWNLWEESGREMYITCASPYAKKVLSSNRLDDLFAGKLFASLEDALAHLDSHAGTPPYGMEVRDEGGSSVITFSGSLKPVAVSPAEIRVIASRVKGEHCTMDLSGLDSISTQGIILLLRLKSALVGLGIPCRAGGAQGEAALMLKATKTENLI
jgi:N-acetylglucosaminyldiphosphoundecaprenol N-acetyl-beta-D-mannosaminyltransferase